MQGWREGKRERKEGEGRGGKGQKGEMGRGSIAIGMYSIQFVKDGVYFRISTLSI